MKCRTASEWMDALLDESLEAPRPPSSATDAVRASSRPAQWRAHLDQHLAGCPVCRRQWDALQSAERALRAPQPAAVPDGLLLEFRRRLAEHDAAALQPVSSKNWLERWLDRSIGNWWIPAGTLGAAAATACLVLVLRTPSPAVRPVPNDGNAMTLGTPMPLPEDKAMRGAIGRGTSQTERERATDAAFSPATSAMPKAANPATGPRGAAAVPITPLQSVALKPAPESGVSDRLGQVKKDAMLESRTHLSDQATASRNQLKPVVRNLSTQSLAKLPRVEQAISGTQTAQVKQAQSNSFALTTSGNQNAPVEFEVSPAVLLALRRQVTLRSNAGQVQQLADELSQAADVQVHVDPSISGRQVSATTNPEQQEVPLWFALQSVAQQARLEIVPVDNQLMLKAAEPERKVRTDQQAQNLSLRLNRGLEQQGNLYRYGNATRGAVGQAQQEHSKSTRATVRTAPTLPATGPVVIAPAGQTAPAGSALSVTPGGPSGPAPVPPAPIAAAIVAAKPSGTLPSEATRGRSFGRGAGETFGVRSPEGDGRRKGIQGGFGGAMPGSAGAPSNTRPATLELGKKLSPKPPRDTPERGARPLVLAEPSARVMPDSRRSQPGSTASLSKTPATLDTASHPVPGKAARPVALGTGGAREKEGVAAYLADRRVWPSEWGFLPERGFAPPTREEFDQGKLAEATAVRPAARMAPVTSKAQPRAKRTQRRR